MKVKDPTGQTWRVTRRWVPWRRRLKGWMGESFGWLSLGDDPISLVLLVVVGIPVLLIGILAAAEALLLLLVFPLFLLARVLFGRHWTIEAREGFRIHWQDVAGDWQASGVRIHEVVAAIERGHLPPQNVDAVPEPPSPQSTGTDSP